ncbi:molybdopterin molybdotransferase MoeA [Dyella sp. A6]|uniref:molybdopterin molybdotransferase MoeA n=1 Tax=Dyella aluminiiresistens TaxID=3069105 RepID=UPI002E7AA840|nr:molybdopterin molybdotransferase MoeA [Dyella sp. A6]
MSCIGLAWLSKAKLRTIISSDMRHNLQPRAIECVMSDLLSVTDAEQRIRTQMPSFGSERLPLDAVMGRVLRQGVRAERDQPPFDRVMMDGIAIILGDGAIRSFRREGIQLAGMCGQVLRAPDGCIEVTTGATLPVGCDCVIPVEQIRREGDRFALVEDCLPTRRQFVHPQSSDCHEGAQLLVPGVRIRAPEMAVLAANGVAEVEVAKLPSVAIIATGDELANVDQSLAPGQVRRSNDRALATALAARGFNDVVLTHVPDDLAATKQKLADLLATRQVLVLSGGVSMGQRDYVPEALRSLGVREVLHRVAQRPGKPLWFGIGPQQQVVFALPGNPLSALVCAVRYLLPALEQAVGLTASEPMRVALAAAAITHPSLTCFVPVYLHHDATGRALAQPVPSPTSGDFSSLPKTHGVVELPPAEIAACAGTAVVFHGW